MDLFSISVLVAYLPVINSVAQNRGEAYMLSTPKTYSASSSRKTSYPTTSAIDLTDITMTPSSSGSRMTSLTGSKVTPLSSSTVTLLSSATVTSLSSSIVTSLSSSTVTSLSSHTVTSLSSPPVTSLSSSIVTSLSSSRVTQETASFDTTTLNPDITKTPSLQSSTVTEVTTSSIDSTIWNSEITTSHSPSSTVTQVTTSFDTTTWTQEGETSPITSQPISKITPAMTIPNSKSTIVILGSVSGVVIFLLILVIVSLLANFQVLKPPRNHSTSVQIDTSNEQEMNVSCALYEDVTDSAKETLKHNSEQKLPHHTSNPYTDLSPYEKDGEDDYGKLHLYENTDGGNRPTQDSNTYSGLTVYVNHGDHHDYGEIRHDK